MFGGVYKDKTVLVTGHTGFKGAWLSLWLTALGAKVVGFSLAPYPQWQNKNVFSACNLGQKIFADERGDIRNIAALDKVVKKYSPSMVFHLAALSLVRPSYQNPKETYEVNVMGSVNVLETVRANECLQQAIMVTSDKCYKNIGKVSGYCEDDAFGGNDVYSSSKGCDEIMIASWRHSFFNPDNYDIHKKAVASVRAGNVIGGGDRAEDRLIPDCIRALEENRDIIIRNPAFTRPWQFVLEALYGYLLLGQKLTEQPTAYAEGFNFAPNADVQASACVQKVVDKLIKLYGSGAYQIKQAKNAPHEDKLLSLNAGKALDRLGWKCRLTLDEALAETVLWYKAAAEEQDMYDFSLKQIARYEDCTCS